MKKIIYTLLIITNFCFCQEKSGYIIYSLNIGENEDLSKGELASYFKKAKDNAKFIEFILDFNAKEMTFYSESLEVEGKSLAFTKAFSGILGKYYKNIDDSFALVSIENGVTKNTTIKVKTDLKWKFLSESKTIQNFKCYKATAILKFNNGIKDVEKEIIAWYCPEIHNSFGLKGYGGLPGLILELQEDSNIIGAKKIVFNKNNNKIIMPTGKIISEEEYNKTINNYFEDEKN